VCKVKLEMAEKRVEIAMAWTPAAMHCPECGARCPQKGITCLSAHGGIWMSCRLRPCSERGCRWADCPEHGVKTVRVPWAGPGSRFTWLFERFAIDVILASRSLSQAKELLGLHWDSLQGIINRAVERGLERRELEQLRYLGLDEKSFGKGQSDLSLLTDLEGSRVLEVMEGRDQQRRPSFFFRPSMKSN
jgi:hypothetical protein